MIHPCDRRTDGTAIAYTRYGIYAVVRKVLDRLKQVGVRTSSRKNFGVRAAFAGRMPYFTIIKTY